MMIRVGNFLFHYRDALFPIIYLLLLVPSPWLIPNYKLAIVVGFAVALLGQSLRALTIGLDYIIRGGQARRVYAERLVQGGVFAHSRNPLYLGNILILLGVGIASNSIFFLLTGFPILVFSYTAIIAAEENYLRNRFGREFDEYCSRVNRLFPNFSGFRKTLTGMRFNWRRLITAEYGSTYIWVLAIALIAFRNIWLAGEYHTFRWGLILSWSVIGGATLGYLTARILKKRGLLNSAPPTPQPVSK